jgi:hypothetical protein
VILEESREVKWVIVQDQTSSVANNLKQSPAGHASEVAPGSEAKALVDLREEHECEEGEVEDIPC